MNAQQRIETSTNFAGSLVQALAEIEGASKSSENPHFRSKYADLSSVIDAIRPVLARHELAFTQGTEPSEGGVVIETMVHHSSGESMSFGKLFVPANKNDAQGFGSALTYARRYSLMTAFGVAPEDDDGNAASRAGAANEDQRDPTIPGITKIRNNLNKLRRDGGKAEDLDAFNALVSANADDLTKIKEADHSLWTGMGEDFDGFRAWIQSRRAELAPQPAKSLNLQMLLSLLEQCATRNDLSALLDEHGPVADELDDAEEAAWAAAYDAREAAIMAVAPVSAG